MAKSFKIRIICKLCKKVMYDDELLDHIRYNHKKEFNQFIKKNLNRRSV